MARARRADNVEFEGSTKIAVELKGRCFNASLTVEKHEQQCPWCQEKQDQQLMAFVGQTVCVSKLANIDADRLNLASNISFDLLT